MNLGKLPGIKGLVSSSHGRRRFKGDLTTDMISPPLGDFRHTMHVGRGGDVFGDTSFLSNHGSGGGDSDSNSEKTSGFFSRTLRHVRKTPMRSGGSNVQELSPPPPPISPIIKNAISLPWLDVDTPNGCLKRELFPSSPSCPEDSIYSYGLESGFATLPRLSCTDGQLQASSAPCSPEPQHNLHPDDGILALPRSDSTISFTVDLGPSLMSEVLGIIDSPIGSREISFTWKGEGQEEELTNHKAEIDLVTTPSAESPFRLELNDREITGEDQQANGDSARVAVLDRLVESSARVELGMEAERFQRAADVLSCHYGGGRLFKTQQKTDGAGHIQHLSSATASNLYTERQAPCIYPEEEDEIKV